MDLLIKDENPKGSSKKAEETLIIRTHSSVRHYLSSYLRLARLFRPSPATPYIQPPSTSSKLVPSFTMRLSYFLLAPVLALSTSAQILPRTFNIEGCVSATTVLKLVLDASASAAAGVHSTEESCAVSDTIPLLDHKLISSIDCLPRSQTKLRLLLPFGHFTTPWSDRRLRLL
jgi:hypothetical protein